MNIKIKKITIVTVMIALDVVLSPIFRIEGMAPMSSVMNIIAGVTLGPFYTVVMALITGIIRIVIMGIPPLALTGAVFGALLSSLFYKYGRTMYWAMFGEFVGTGLSGSLISYPVMVWFTGTHQGLYWMIYTPRFIGATLIGAVIAYFILLNLTKIKIYQDVQQIFMKSSV